MSKYTKDVRKARFPTPGEESYKMELEKARENPLVLKWNWKYHYELVVLNIYTQKYVQTNVCMCVPSSVH